jgi:glycosyltransferase involved in cell wall biosynthesis
MKLIIQIPCLNEANTLPRVLSAIPRYISGVDQIEVVVIDDGSTDGTADVARAHGASEVVRNVSNLGLAFTFRRGIDTCLRRGADIIVNIDGDNQYPASEIPVLIAPILSGKAGMVIGDRHPGAIADFSLPKRLLQRLGSWVVRRLSGTKALDAASGFRAFSREAALKLTILNNYTYTHEAILQARSKGIEIANVPISVNPKTRESRLMSSLQVYLAYSLASIIRVFAMYNPLRLFLVIGAWLEALGILLVARFAWFYFQGAGSGKVQSLILAAVLIICGALVALVGVMADLIQFNRRLLEDILERVKRLEFNKP